MLQIRICNLQLLEVSFVLMRGKSEHELFALQRLINYILIIQELELPHLAEAAFMQTQSTELCSFSHDILRIITTNFKKKAFRFLQ